MSELDRTAVLNRSAVAALAAELRPVPAVQAAATGIVHLGLGAFARSHVFDFTADAVEAGGGDWGVLAVAPRSAARLGLLLARGTAQGHGASSAAVGPGPPGFSRHQRSQDAKGWPGSRRLAAATRPGVSLGE